MVFGRVQMKITRYFSISRCSIFCASRSRLSRTCPQRNLERRPLPTMRGSARISGVTHGTQFRIPKLRDERFKISSSRSSPEQAKDDSLPYRLKHCSMGRIDNARSVSAFDLTKAPDRNCSSLHFPVHPGRLGRKVSAIRGSMLRARSLIGGWRHAHQRDAEVEIGPKRTFGRAPCP
jgi:hypothetical protein